MLPITKPAITSYLHCAHDLSIAQTDPRSKEYLAVAFLQLYTKSDSTGTSLLIDFYDHRHGYPLCPFLEGKRLTGQEIRRLGASATEIACNLIDRQRYVRVDLNEFHIRDSVSYQKRGADLSWLPAKFRPLHFNLIYRYCATERKFFTHGFNAQMHYTDRCIDFDEFERAYYGDKVGMHTIRLLPPGPNDGSLYSADAVIGYLTDFMEASSNFLTTERSAFQEYLKRKVGHRCNFLGFQPLGSTFGMATYDVAAGMVEKNNGKAIDIRPWCIFLDHKRSLLRLFDYLSGEKHMVFESGTRKNLKLLENDFLGLRNYMLESRLSDRKVKMTSLINNIERLKEADREAISALVSGIRKHSGTNMEMKAA
jgi:hypothetical protein